MRRLKKDERLLLAFTLNGRPVSGDAEPRMLLSDFLRHALGATGTHVGCEHGVCGCCTVLSTASQCAACLTLAVQAEGRSDLDSGIRSARPTARSTRCKRHSSKTMPCSAVSVRRGSLMSFTDYLARNPHPTEAEIRRGPQRAHLSVHRLCRHRRRCARRDARDAPSNPKESRSTAIEASLTANW